MTCEGGCVAGPGTIAKSNIAARSVERFAEKTESIFKTELSEANPRKKITSEF
jgi:iron only hydrogenase large subunit-like protein